MVLVAVIGAGVVGLTTALKILEAGYDVVIVAELFPGDPRSIRYTSNFAGANHMSMAGDDMRQLQLDRETFEVVWKMSEPGAPTEKLFMRTPVVQYYDQERKGPDPLEDFMPEYHHLDKSELRLHSIDGVSYMSVTFDVWRYLPYLYSQAILKGARVVRAQIQHINQVLQGAFSDVPDAVVVCAGIGARTLGGVEDKNVYPIRGQTVLIHAPWIKSCMGIRRKSANSDTTTYIIPRACGDVILGGTWLENDWYPKPRAETTKIILEGAIELAPELAPPEVLATGKKPTAADLEPIIVELGCGLRPGRLGGLRLERDVIQVGNEKRVPIVFNYGHGGQGYQSSFGSAAAAVRLLEEGLKEL